MLISLDSATRTTPVLVPYVLANKDPYLTTASGNLTQGSNTLPDNNGQESIASRGRCVINPMTVIPVVYRVKLFIFSTVATAAILSLYLSKYTMPLPVWTPSNGFRIIRYPLHQIFAVNTSFFEI